MLEHDLVRVKRQDDLAAAASGGGHYCPDGVPLETAIFAILGAIGVAFGILYRAVTSITGGRRKRSEAPPPQDIWEEFSLHITDLFWWGNNDFSLQYHGERSLANHSEHGCQPCKEKRRLWRHLGGWGSSFWCNSSSRSCFCMVTLPGINNDAEEKEKFY